MTFQDLAIPASILFSGFLMLSTSIQLQSGMLSYVGSSIVILSGFMNLIFVFSLQLEEAKERIKKLEELFILLAEEEK